MDLPISSHLTRVPKFVLKFPASLSTIKALHKYEVRAFRETHVQPSQVSSYVSYSDLARVRSSHRSVSVSTPVQTFPALTD